MDEQRPDPSTTPAANSHAIAIASELNNLLQIISGTGAVIENLIGTNAEADKHFSAIRSSVDRAAQLTSSLTHTEPTLERKIVPYPEHGYAIPPKRTARASATKQRVLVVDDEPLALELAQQVFADAGFEAQTANSGFECIDRVRSARQAFDLVLLDLSMPFMDGEETFTRLRSMVPHITVMLNTGFVAQERLERMLQAGLAGFIRKPHRPSELVAHVRSVLHVVKLSRSGCAVNGGAVSSIGAAEPTRTSILSGSDICRV
jgi:CheY-like chemotaxis protein